MIQEQLTWMEYGDRVSIHEEGRPRVFLSSNMTATDLIGDIQ